MQIKEQVVAVPLKADNLDPKYVITEIDDTVKVKFEGPGDKLADPGLKNAVAIVDLSKAAPGRHLYSAIIEAPDPEVQRLLPRDYAKVLIGIETKASKTFSITVEPKGRISDRNLRYDVSAVEPQEVIFSGSQSRVDSIRKARVILDLGDFDPNESDRTFSLPIEGLDANGRPVPYVVPSVSLIKVHPSVEPATVDKELFIIPKLIGRPAPGYEVREYTTVPEKLSVTGGSLTLSQTSSLSTEPIDVGGLNGTVIREAALVLPKELKLMQTRTVTVRVVIQRQQVPKADTPPAATVPAFPDRVPPLIPRKGGLH